MRGGGRGGERATHSTSFGLVIADHDDDQASLLAAPLPSLSRRASRAASPLNLCRRALPTYTTNCRSLAAPASPEEERIGRARASPSCVAYVDCWCGICVHAGKPPCFDRGGHHLHLTANLFSQVASDAG